MNIVKKIDLGIVVLAFLTSPPTAIDVLIPWNAKNRIIDILPISLIEGIDDICKLFKETSITPKNMINNNGIIFIIVISFTKLMPYLIPITLTYPRPEKRIKRLIILIIWFWKNGKDDDIIS